MRIQYVDCHGGWVSNVSKLTTQMIEKLYKQAISMKKNIKHNST